MRRYFILDRVSPDEVEALTMCIGELDTQRYSLDGTKILIKTTQLGIDTYRDGDVSILGIEYSLEDLMVILNSSEWINNDII